MAKDVEVRTKLKLDDLASAVLDKITGKFEQTNEAQKEAQGGFSDFASTFAAQFAAVNLAPAIGQVQEFARGLLHAGLEGQDADKAIAAMIATSQGDDWENALEGGQYYGDLLDEIGLKANQAADDVGDAFQRMIEITGASNGGLKQARDTTESLAIVANRLKKSTVGLGQEYAFMAEGTLKTRGQLFQLLQTTGIFGDKTKGVAEQWAKLTDAKRIELLQYGIGKVAASMKDAAPTMSDLVTKAQNFSGIVQEKFGQGLVEEVAPAFESLLDELVGGRGEIEKNADAMGREVGRYVKEAAKTVREGFEFVRSHYAELKETVVSAFDHAKSIVSWILEHKEAIAIAFGAKTALGLGSSILGSGAAQGAKGLVQGAASLGSAVAPALQGGALGSTVANLTTALGGATMGIAALGAGIVLLGGAAYATSKIIDDQNQEHAARMAAMQNIEDAAFAGDIQKTRDLTNAMADLGSDVNSLGQAIGQLDEQTVRYYQSLNAIAESTAAIQNVDADQVRGEIELATRGIADAYARASSDTSKAGQDYAANMYANQTAILIDAYNQASRSGNNALAALAATTLASSKGTQLAFLEAGKEVEGGFGALADVVAAGGSQFADFASKLRAIKPKEAATPAAPTVNIGSATFNIKQDFRDADPDRILLAFRKDLIKSAQRRYTTATGSVFGT